jgi:hypothetical protein
MIVRRTPPNSACLSRSSACFSSSSTRVSCSCPWMTSSSTTAVSRWISSSDPRCANSRQLVSEDAANVGWRWLGTAKCNGLKRCAPTLGARTTTTTTYDVPNETKTGYCELPERAEAHDRGVNRQLSKRTKRGWRTALGRRGPGCLTALTVTDGHEALREIVGEDRYRDRSSGPMASTTRCRYLDDGAPPSGVGCKVPSRMSSLPKHIVIESRDCASRCQPLFRYLPEGRSGRRRSSRCCYPTRTKPASRRCTATASSRALGRRQRPDVRRRLVFRGAGGPRRMA